LRGRTVRLSIRHIERETEVLRELHAVHQEVDEEGVEEAGGQIAHQICENRYIHPPTFLYLLHLILMILMLLMLLHLILLYIFLILIPL